MTNNDLADLRAALARRHWIFRCTVKVITVFTSTALLLLSQGARARSAIIAGLLAAATYLLGGLDVHSKHRASRHLQPPDQNRA